MKRGAGHLALTLLISVVAVATFLSMLSSISSSLAVKLAIRDNGDSRPETPLRTSSSYDAFPPATHLTFASGPSFCKPDGFYTDPLTIPLKIRDTFGPRLLQPVGYSRYDFHRGIDWPHDKNIPVYAVTTGTVRASRDDWPVDTLGSGKFIHLLHKEIGCETRYNHLSEVYVEDGDVVTPGQIIGRMGDTGAMYRHLHFEVRRGLTVTQRSAIHPLSAPFLPWTNTLTPAVTFLGVFTDATGLTALIDVTSPFTEPDVTTVSVDVSGAVTDGRTIDYVDLSANTPVVADLDDPLVNDVCIIPTDLTVENDYRVTMAFRRLKHAPSSQVTAQVFDVDGRSSQDIAVPNGGLEVSPPVQVVHGTPGQLVTLVYTLTNHGGRDTFTLTHLSAQGWPSVVIPRTTTLANGQSIAVTVGITVNTGRFGPPDCGLLVAEAHSVTQRIAAGFYRAYRDTYVSVETGSDTTGTGSITAPLKTIRYAICQTDAGGTIHVANGTYTNNLTLTRTINLLAGYPVVDGNTVDWTTRTLAAYVTTVDGGGNGAVLTIDGDYGPLVEGFTFFNGHRNGAGGGVRLVGGAAPTLRSNWILSNTADLSGGGIYVGPYGMLPPTIIYNTIAANTSMSSFGGGGGIYVKDRPALIQGNTISDNQATSNDGGGIYLTGKTTAQVLGNWIMRNKAGDDGGGVLVRSSGAHLANNVVADNQADSEGSGIFIHGSSPRLLHTTIARNGGSSKSGVHVADWSGTSSFVVMTNTILVSHAVGITITAGNIATLTATLWGTAAWANDQDWGGDGSIIIGNVDVWGDPAFVNPDEGNYHIGLNSEAIDEGVDTAVNNDIDGDLRPQCGGQDIGADEINCVYLPIIIKNRS